MALTGKTALVTGGSRGIGRGIAEQLGRDGALVAVHYATNAAAAAEVVEAIAAAGGSAFALGQPLGVDGDAAGLFAQLDAELRARTGSTRLDVLVNNAGVGLAGTLESTSAELYDELLAVNARAAFFVTQAAAERMGAGGRIVTLSSGVTHQASPDLVAYAMSKGAVEVMTRALAKHLAPREITVNVVAPGVVDTDMNAGWLRASDEGRAAGAAVSAFGRVGEVDDIADVVAFAVSHEARWVTGQVLDASGGSVL